MGRKRRRSASSSSTSSADDSRSRSQRQMPHYERSAAFDKPAHVGASGGAVTVQKLRSERQKLLSEHFGYSNDNNPFGDKTLAEPFVWKKKNLLLQAAGKKQATTASALLSTSVNKVQEIKSVKKRREEREAEEMLLQQQREELQREKEREHYQDYFEKEEVFHRMMHLKKTEIRAEQNREMPIDLIVKGLRMLNGEKFEKTNVLPVPPHEVFDCFNKEPMTVEMIEEMIADIKLHIGVDTTAVDKDYQEFWKSLLVITKDGYERALKKKKILDELLKDSSAESAAKAAALLANSAGLANDIRESDSGIVVSVASDITAVLGGKSPEELDELQRQIEAKLATEDDIDSTYWEAILKKVPLFRARAVCLEYHKRIVEKALELEREVGIQRAEAEAAAQREFGESGLTDNLLMTEEEAKRVKVQQIQEAAKKVARAVEKEVNPGADGSFSPELEPYDDEAEAPEPRGPYSPLLFPFDEFRTATDILHPDEELEQRQALRRVMQQKQRERRLLQLGIEKEKDHEAGGDEDEILDPAAKNISFEEFVRKEKKNINPDEEIMAESSELKLKQHYGWEEQYRPRKPRFFNRVRTAYFWNKYNQTHYDHDNPPPKMVQGYKFNIFYPDLIDKTKTPTWTLEPSDTPDTVIVRFHAGPPYEDVAFKILNREWHLERMRGFRNIFDRGIMQLYFSFKTYCYRR